MKIKKQYDLLKKIKHSKDGISAKEIFIKAILRAVFLHACSFSIMLSSIMISIIVNNMFLVLLQVFTYFAGYSLVYGASMLCSKVNKQQSINKAEIDLQQLVNELSKLEVKTSVELLQEAKVNQIDYKIKYEDDDKIPRLVQYKYIDVPLVSGYEETLLQEHKYGDKDYELSVNSPVKKMNYKVAKINI